MKTKTNKKAAAVKASKMHNAALKAWATRRANARKSKRSAK